MFFIGKKAGAKVLDRLVQKNAKLSLLQGITKQNEWFVSFLVRIVGFLPSILNFSIMGMSIFVWREKNTVRRTHNGPYTQKCNQHSCHSG